MGKREKKKRSEKNKLNQTTPADAVEMQNDGFVLDEEKRDSDDTFKNEAPLKPYQPPLINFFKLFRFATPIDFALMSFGVFGSMLTGLSAPGNTLIFGDLTDAMVNYSLNTITSDRFLVLIDEFALNNSLIGLGLLILTYLSVSAFNEATHRQLHRIRILFFESALRQDIAWYDLNNTGDFASRMSEDINKLEDCLSEKLLLVVHCFSAFLGCIILALVKGWELALLSLSSLPIITGVIGTIAFLSSKLSKNELLAYAKAGSVAQEVLSSIRTVQAFSGENKENKRYGKFLDQAKKNNIRRHFFNGVTYGFLWLLIYSSYAFAFWFGVSFVFDQKYLPGQMTTVFFSVMVGSMNFGMATPHLEMFSTGRAAASKVFWVIDRISEIDPMSEKGSKPPEIQGNIEFKNVSFEYPSRPSVPVLKNVSFKINQGETVAFVGSSGCGKSTCIQLIQRFYDPSKGTVTVDDEDIKDINVRYLRQHIGIVGQEPVLFQATIEENIRYAKEDATPPEIIKAAKMANAHNFINMLPQGYQTIVGDRGAQMSGGQKQRLAIARALIRKPAILLLDEATSALDNASEAKVQEALDKASKGRTTIIVAHRLSTIRQANKIIVLSKGEIVEEGTHESLLKLKGHYYELVTAQDIGLVDTEKEETEKPESVTSVKEEDEEDEEPYKTETEIFKEEPLPEKKKEEKVSLKEVFKLSTPERGIVGIGVLSSLAVGFCSPFFSIVFGDIMGVFNKERDQGLADARIYCLYFVLIGGLMGLGTFVTFWAYGLAGERLTRRLRALVFAHMLRQDMSWYDDKANSVGALCARLSTDTSNVQGATGQPIGSVVQGIGTISLAVSFAMYFQWKLGLATLAFTPLLFGGSYYMAKAMTGDAKFRLGALEKSNKIAIEAVSNIRTVAGICREPSLYKEFRQALLPARKILTRGSHLRAIALGMSRSIMFFTYATCMYYGGRLIVEEGVKYDDIFKVTQTLIMASFSLANCFAFTPNFQKGLASAKRIIIFLRTEPKIKDPFVTINDIFWSSNGNVNYENINFSYPTRPEAQILKDLNLEVLSGKKVALIGQSGCGKSTVIQLLVRFYDPDEGVVRLDARDIKTLKVEDLRNELGIVSQEPVLFDRTIAENIAYGDNTRRVDMKDIMDAAVQANIHSFVENLPEKYDTRLGEKGAQLSGGQKQRVAIARALIRKPKVLLLDEATSALDTQSEKVVQEALDRASEGRTSIIIAHRLSTIQDADLIVVISQGSVAEQGTHSELIATDGMYKRLTEINAR